MKKTGMKLLLFACSLALILCACGNAGGGEMDVKVIENKDGAIYATSADGKTFLFYYPANEQTAFTVPEGIEIVAENAFVGTTSLRQLSFSADVKTVLCDFSGSSFEKITIPDTVESFCADFSDCLSLKELVICSLSQDSADIAINNSAVETLILPENLTAFSNPWVFDATNVKTIKTDKVDTPQAPDLESRCEKTIYMPAGLRTVNVDQWIGLGEQGETCGLYFSDSLQALDLRGTLYSGGGKYVLSVPADVQITCNGEPVIDGDGNYVYDGFITVILRQ